MKTHHTTLMLLAAFLSASCSKRDSAIAVEENPVVMQLNRIVIPNVDLSEVTIDEAFIYVQHRTKVHEMETDATPNGIRILIRGPLRAGDEVRDIDVRLDAIEGERMATITYSAGNIAYLDLVAEIARQARMDAYLASTGIMVIPEGESPFLNTKTDKGVIWKTLRKTQKSKEGEQAVDGNPH